MNRAGRPLAPVDDTVSLSTQVYFTVGTFLFSNSFSTNSVASTVLVTAAIVLCGINMKLWLNLPVTDSWITPLECLGKH